MAYASVIMPDGRSWIPKFVAAINDEKCSGCEACARTCTKKCISHAAMEI